MKARTRIDFPFRFLWERQFFKEITSTFLLFILCFYALYFLIDFSIHASLFYRYYASFQWEMLATYYLSDFIRRIDVIIPFALLVATIKTLVRLNINNELVALMAGGLSLKKLLRPFLILGLACVIFVYISMEFWLPKASMALRHIESMRTSQKKKNQNQSAAHSLVLQDNSILLFHHYNAYEQKFYDAYWVRSINDLYHFKILEPYFDIPKAHHSEHFLRNASGELILDSYEEKTLLSEFRINQAALRETLVTFEDLSLSEIEAKLPKTSDLTEKEAHILTIYYYKLAIPWLSLLAIIGPAPFCVRYTRQLPIFFIYAAAMFGLVTIYLVLDAAMILGKRQMLPPEIAIGIPLAIFFFIFGFKFLRTK